MATAMHVVPKSETRPSVNTGVARQIGCLADALSADLGDGFRLFEGSREDAEALIREFLRTGLTSGALGRFYIAPVGDNVAVDVVCRALQTGARLAILAAGQPDRDSRLALLETADTGNLDSHNWPIDEVGGAY